MAACGMRPAGLVAPVPRFRRAYVPRGINSCTRLPLAVRAALRAPEKSTDSSSTAAKEPVRARLGRGLAAAAGAAAAALAGLLPAGAAAAADQLVAPFAAAGFDLDLDLPFDGTPPKALEVMFLVMVTYVGLMALYVWLASMVDEGPGSGGAAGTGGGGGGGKLQGGGGGGGGPAGQQQQRSEAQQQPSDLEMPPGYSSMLHAHIRSARDPARGHALVAPADPALAGCGAHALAGVKESLAAQAADYVAAQTRECASVVRRKLYLRRLAARDAARLGGAAAPRRGAASSGLALMLGQPGQMEAWVDECLDNMTPDLMDEACDDTLVRSITAATARRLAAAEAGELVRSMQAAVAQRKAAAAAEPAYYGYEPW
ncbi:MAG: hypothetical protein J3K34DRAFT_520516 [Monoraphidium minutum]|nr:MAG: hypothetical protein J3K34DRAFT_520516 [Monoraphidium minutum]